MSGWTDERRARAKTLWANGKSAAAIAVVLGDVTRNAVLGMLNRDNANVKRPTSVRAPAAARSAKVDRMKDWQPKPVAPDKIDAERRRQLRQRDAGVKATTKKPPASPFGNMAKLRQVQAGIPLRSAPLPGPVAEPTSATNVSLTALEYGMCRYPIGPLMERATLFCGGPVREGHSWCEGHCLRVYQPREARRKSAPGYTPKPIFEEA